MVKTCLCLSLISKNKYALKYNTNVTLSLYKNHTFFSGLKRYRNCLKRYRNFFQIIIKIYKRVLLKMI